MIAFSKDSPLASIQFRGCGANVRHADMCVAFAVLPSGSEYRVPDSGRSFALSTKTAQVELSLTDGVHQLNAGDRNRGVAELLEPQHHSDTLLDAAVVMLNQVIIRHNSIDATSGL